MQNIQEVSLGFAEFVSQLIQETFDAILSSQNYQLERYAELQSRLDLPNATYREAYRIPEKVADRILRYFGVALTTGTAVDQALTDFLTENFDDSSGFVDGNGNLTQVGYDAIEIFIIDLIITEEKNMLNALINQSDVSRVVVDAGEITAKLELSSMFASSGTDGGDGTATGGGGSTNNPNGGGDGNSGEGSGEGGGTGNPDEGGGEEGGNGNPDEGSGEEEGIGKEENGEEGTSEEVESNPDPKATPEPEPEPNEPSEEEQQPPQNESTVDPNNAGNVSQGNVNALLLPSYGREVRVFQFQNDQTGRNTILIDRDQFSRFNSSNVLIPNVRLSAQPTKLTTNSNLYSEIKISFKTL